MGNLIKPYPTVGLTLSLVRREIDEQNNNVLDRSRTYDRIIPAIRISLSRDLSLRAEYFSVRQKFDDAAQGESEQNIFSINLKYNFPSI